MRATLFVGLGDFGVEISKENFDNFIDSNQQIVDVIGSLNIDSHLVFKHGNGEEKTLAEFKFSKQKSYKDNFTVFNKQENVLNDSIKESLESIYLLNETRAQMEDGINVIIYFSLGDYISSIIVRKITELITKNSLYKNKRIDIYFIAFTPDLDTGLISSDDLQIKKRRAFACLTELDNFFNLPTCHHIISFTVLSKYFADQVAILPEKKDVTPLTFNLTNRIIKSQLGSLTDEAFRRRNPKFRNKRIIYNTFGSAKLRYDKKKVWTDICNSKKINNLTQIYNDIEDKKMQRTDITVPINKFVLNKFDIDHHLTRLHNELGRNLEGRFFIDFLDFHQTHLQNNNQLSAISSADYIGLLEDSNQRYYATVFQDMSQKIGNNCELVKEEFIKSLNQQTIEKFYKTNDEENGLAGIRAGLKKFLDIGEDNKLEGDVLLDESSFNDLIYKQLEKFKGTSLGIPEDERDPIVRDIQEGSNLKDITAKIINLQKNIQHTKQAIINLDKFYLNKDVSFETTNIKDGYFTINGEKIDINGCLQTDSTTNKSEIFSPSISENEIKASIDLRGYLSNNIENQGNIGSCVANAITTAIEYLASRKTKKEVDMSRLFLYYIARKITDSDELGEGCNIYTALKKAQSSGVCLENTWPYLLENTDLSPPSFAYLEAEKFKIETFQTMKPDLNNMLSCLSEGYPFVFGLRLFESFNSNHNGVISVPKKGELASSEHAGHAMICVGYNKEKEYFIVRNSWGAEWGDQGYCFIPFEYMTNSNMVFDIYTIKSVDEKVNSTLRINIIGEDISFFDSGIHHQQEVDVKGQELKKYEKELEELTIEYQKINTAFITQNEWFSNVGNRLSLKEKLEKLQDKDIRNQQEEILKKEEEIINKSDEIQEKINLEKPFIRRMVLFPLVLWVIIALLLGTLLGWAQAISFITEVPRYIVSTILNEPQTVYKFKLLRFILGSFTISAFVFWFCYALFRWIRDYVLPIRKLKAEKVVLEYTMTKLRSLLEKEYANVWEKRFRFYIDNKLLDNILLEGKEYLESMLNKVIEFIDTIKGLREDMSNSYIKQKSKESIFINDIISIYDIQKKESEDRRTEFLEKEKELETLHNDRERVNYELKEFEHQINIRDSFYNDMKKYFDEYFFNNQSGFLDDFNDFWKHRQQGYEMQYSLSNLLDNNDFQTHDNIGNKMKWLYKFSTPLTSVHQTSSRASETIDLYYSNPDFQLYVEKGEDIFPGSLWISREKFDGEDPNSFEVFRSLNTFPAYLISYFVDMQEVSLEEQYFIYDIEDYSIFEKSI